jgi:hypothetical protein
VECIGDVVGKVLSHTAVVETNYLDLLGDHCRIAQLFATLLSGEICFDRYLKLIPL